MVDCSTTNKGCNGGDPQFVYTDIMSKFPSRGIYTNAVYPVRKHISSKVSFHAPKIFSNKLS
jgi:hypothetical protein